MNIFIIQGKSGIYPGIWMSRAMAEADREMVACAGVSGDVTEMVPASEVREKDELIQKLCDSVQRKIDRMSCDSLESEGADFLKSFGLRKVGGTWEKMK